MKLLRRQRHFLLCQESNPKSLILIVVWPWFVYLSSVAKTKPSYHLNLNRNVWQRTARFLFGVGNIKPISEQSKTITIQTNSSSKLRDQITNQVRDSALTTLDYFVNNPSRHEKSFSSVWPVVSE